MTSLELATVTELRSQETNTPEEVRKDPQEQKIRGILNRMADAAMGPGGLRPIDADMNWFRLESPAILQPGRHRPGIDVMHFHNGIWIQGTTEDDFEDETMEWNHRLKIYTDGQPNVYSRTQIHIPRDATPITAHMVGDKEIAADEHIEFNLGQLSYGLKAERQAGWRRALSRETLRLAQKPHIIR